MANQPSAARSPIIIGGAVLIAAALAWKLFLAGGSGPAVGGEGDDRIAAMGRAVAQQGEAAVDDLLSAAESDGDQKVRRAALLALSRYPSAKIRPAIDLAVSDPQPGIRAAATAPLGAFHDEQAAQTLDRLAREDQERDVRLAALRGLKSCDHPWAWVALMQIAEYSGEPDMKLLALQFLSNKMNFKLNAKTDPVRRPDHWRWVVERTKLLTPVQDAFGQCNVALDHKPRFLFAYGHDPSEVSVAAGGQAPEPETEPDSEPAPQKP